MKEEEFVRHGGEAPLPIVLAPRMRRIFALLQLLRASPLPLLLLGETGSGKEVVAEWAHRLSKLADRPMVKTNCAGLTESVVESELFGHERGAFTGAVQSHRGLFEAADGGTLFLDELAELPLRTQAKLLRVIECGEFTRLGSTQVRQVKVRFIAATHRDLSQQMERGEFRKDLYFRLNGASISIPPLRKRREEIVPLATLFLERAAAATGGSRLRLADDAADVLLGYDWPGNVRELRNVIECAAALAQGAELDATVLRAATRLRHASQFDSSIRPEPARAVESPVGSASPAQLRRELSEFERERICRALEQSHGNQTVAASLLGISRRTLTNKLNQHGIARPRKGAAEAPSLLPLPAPPPAGGRHDSSSV